MRGRLAAVAFVAISSLLVATGCGGGDDKGSTGGGPTKVDSFYDQNGLRQVYPQQLLDQISYQGHIYSVPVNIHRSNVLWYSPKVLDEAGIAKAPATVAEFISDLKTVKEKTN